MKKLLLIATMLTLIANSADARGFRHFEHYRYDRYGHVILDTGLALGVAGLIIATHPVVVQPVYVPQPVYIAPVQAYPVYPVYR